MREERVGTSVADPGCLFRILIFTHPGSRIQKQQQKRGVKKICCHTFFVATNFAKVNIISFLACWKKKFGPIFQELWKFLPKKLSLSSQKYGFEIRDPGSGKNLFRIPDPGVKKAPDPWTGSATLVVTDPPPNIEENLYDYENLNPDLSVISESPRDSAPWAWCTLATSQPFCPAVQLLNKCLQRHNELL